MQVDLDPHPSQSPRDSFTFQTGVSARKMIMKTKVKEQVIKGKEDKNKKGNKCINKGNTQKRKGNKGKRKNKGETNA